MAKSLRCKREKRLRAIKRELVQPIYEKKEAAKHAILEAALAAPKLPVRSSSSTAAMDATTSTASIATNADMDVEMADGSQSKRFLKPLGKKMKKKLKLAKKNYRGKGKIRKKNV